VQDSVAVTLERGAELIRRLGSLATAAASGTRGGGREPQLLRLAGHAIAPDQVLHGTDDDR
jgi:hypothetical protein